MASKRKKGEISSSAPTQSFDKKRFISYEASKRYHQWLANKNLIPERGLLLDHEDGSMVEMIRKWKWQQFTGQPEPSAVNIVIEFYAKPKEADDKSVFIRGKWVKTGTKAFNNYYGLHRRKFSGYSVYINEDLDYNEVVTALYELGTDWKLTATQKATKFLSTKLSHYEKAWFAFICIKLMLARHKTDVTKERTALLYCIAMGKTVDVGELINASIKKTLEGSTSGGLPHPSLITDLYKGTGVKWDKEEVLQVPLAPITHLMITRYKVLEGGMSHPNGLGYTLIEGYLDAGPSQPTTDASEILFEIPGPSSSTIEELNRQTQQNSLRIDLVVAQMEGAMKRMNKKMDRIASRQEKMHSYNTSASFSLATILSRMDPAILSTPFPTRSDYTLPAYPTSDLDNDAEGSKEDDDEEDEESDN